jgi:hypothetical protein
MTVRKRPQSHNGVNTPWQRRQAVFLM